MSGGGSSGNQTSTTTNKLDPQVAQWTANNYAKAQGVANQPYNPYTGEMVAPLNGYQWQGIMQGTDQAAGNVGMGALNTGQGLATTAGTYQPQMVGTGAWNAGAAQQYMNPYTQQVIDATNAQIDKNLAQTTNQTNSDATMAGAYGGTRQAVQTAQNQNDANMLKAQTAAQLNNQAYTNAQGMFTSDQARALAAAQGNQSAGLQGANLGLGAADVLARLGLTQQGVSSANANELLTLGSVPQQQQQNLDQWNYQNLYSTPQNWNLRGLSALESAVSGIPYGSSSTSSVPTYSNPWGSALGGAASGAATGSAFGPWGTAIGAGVGGLLGYLGS